MQKYQYFMLLLLLAACVGDPQDIPPGLTEDPVFYSEFTIDGSPSTLQAGVDGYILDTDHETTAVGAVRYRATLRQANCTQCGPKLEFIFWDNNVASEPGSGVEATFSPGEKLFYDKGQEDLLEILFALPENPAGANVAVWTNGSGDIVGQGSSFSVLSMSDQFVDVCYSSMGDAAGLAGGCLSSFCFYLKPDKPCIAWLSAERMIDGHALVKTHVEGTPPFTYRWQNGETTPFVLMPVFEDRPTGVTVVVRDAAGCETQIRQTMRLVNGRPQLCLDQPGFTVNAVQAQFAQFNTVEIRFTDTAGHVFTSSAGVQTEGIFSILSVEEYLLSPQGFATKRIEGQGQCVLYSEDGLTALTLDLPVVSLAVSYSE